MSADKYILTASNAAYLHRLLAAQTNQQHTFSNFLKAKLDAARVWPDCDVPRDVVTLDSRVTFAVNGEFTDTRIISARSRSSIVGLSLPVTHIRGVALLGLAEGQSIALIDRNHDADLLFVEKVRFQPEAQRRFLDDELASNTPANRRAAFRLVHSDSDIHIPVP